VRRAWAAQGFYRDADLFSLFAARAEQYGDETAVVDEDGEISFGDLRALALRIAGGLAERGIVAGDAVGVQLPNSRFACAVDLAVAALGAVVLPYPLGRGGREAAALLTRSEAVCAIVAGVVRGHDYAAATAQLAEELPALRTVVSLDPSPGCEPLAELLRSAPASPARPDPDSAARIMVSSGTESEPKMVAFSHNALATGLGAVVAEVLRPGQRPRSLWLVPLAAAFGSNAVIGTLIGHGGTLLLQPRFDTGRALELIERQRPTHVFGVPTMLRMLLDDPMVATVDLGSVEKVVVGGAKLDPGTARDAAARFGCPIINTYGSSDGVHCMMSGTTQNGRSGRPNPAVVEIRTVDEQLRPVPPGVVGEIVARGPFTPLCYVGAPDLDARYRTAGGWVRTDDLGVLSPDGRLSVVDRRKEIVIRGGANISPAEVEQLLMRHDAIREAACVGVPDAVMGERLCACVRPAPGADVTLRTVTDHLTGCRLESRKLPEYLVLLDALPYTPTGKIDRRELRQIAARATAQRA
jgi:acyl-CoA synthetase (AMP-forming)/AMP-acid ligase II